MGSPHIRPPAVAGTFYPAEAGELRRLVESFLRPAADGAPTPRAVVVPHAGFAYSGPVAGAAYSLFRQREAAVRRVALFGPSHRVYLQGLALSSAAGFRTPLGTLAVDHALDDVLLRLPGCRVLDQAHAPEHSLETQLPFLQVVFGAVPVVPVLMAGLTAAAAADALEVFWPHADTLLVVSTDLSHFKPYEEARRQDDAAAAAVAALRHEDLRQDDACGLVPLRGLLELARRKGLAARALDLRNSGDTAGPRDQVVGYGAWAFHG